MRLGDVDQLCGPLQLRHAQNDLHRDLGGLAVAAIEQCPIVLGQLDSGAWVCSGGIADRCWCGVVRRCIKQAQVCAVDTGERLALQAGKGFAADAEHRQGAFEQGLGDQHAKGQNLIGLSQHQGCGGMTIADQLHQHAATGAGAAPAGDRQHPARQAFATERVVTVDHLTAERVDAAPETQADIGVEQWADRCAINQAATAERSYPGHAGYLSSKREVRSDQPVESRCRPT